MSGTPPVFSYYCECEIISEHRDNSVLVLAIKQTNRVVVSLVCSPLLSVVRLQNWLIPSIPHLHGETHSKHLDLFTKTKTSER